MGDVVIRDVPDGVIAVIDRLAGQLGLSRNECLRRQLSQDAARSDVPVTTADLRNFSEMLLDLTNSDVTAQAWSRMRNSRESS